MKSEFSYRAARHGFTLIELLTVIAIIGILAAILIPVVGRVRESAHQTTCLSNLRQIGLAVLAYDSENGHLPGPTRRAMFSPLNPKRPGAEVPKQMRSAVWPTMNVCMSLLLEDYIGSYNEGDPGPFICQSNLAGTVDTADKFVFLLNRNQYTDPPHFFGDVSFRNPPRPLSHIQAASTSAQGREVTELSQIWMVSDLDVENYVDTGGVSGIQAGPPHNGGRNYAFFDGHAEYRKKGNFPRNSGDSGNR